MSYIVVGGVGPRSQQENANDAWRAVAKELGFIWDTVQPYGSDPHNFTAEAAPTGADKSLDGAVL